MDETTNYVVLDDGETFGGAENANIIIQKATDDELPAEVLNDLENGDPESLFEGIDKGEIEGEIIPIDGLLRLRELAGELKYEDLKDLAKMTEFMDAVGNLDIWD